MYRSSDLYWNDEPPKPQVRGLHELPAVPAEDVIGDWARQNNITDQKLIDAAIGVVDRLRSHVRYFATDPGEITGQLKAAMVIYCKDQYYNVPEFKLALTMRDGRIALASAVNKSESKCTGKPEAECKNLLGEILSYAWDSKFLFDSRTESMKFPRKPDGHGWPDEVKVSNLTRDMEKIWLRNVRPEKKEADTFKECLEQDLHMIIYTSREKNPALRKFADEGQQFHTSDAFVTLEKAIMASEKKRFQAAWSRFTGHFDPEILKTCRDVGIVSPGAYNWLNGGERGWSQRRLQAAQAYPLFFREMVDEEVTKAVDGGKSLTEALAKKIGPNHDVYGMPVKLRPATVQRLQAQYKPEDIRHMPYDSTWHETWARFEALPPEWWPKPEDLPAFTGVVGAVEKYSEIFEVPRVDILREFRGDWRRAVEKLQDDPRHTFGDHGPYFSDRQRESEDYLKAVHRKLYLPVILRLAADRKIPVEDWWIEKPVHTGKRNIISDLFNGLSLVNRLDLVQRWHDRVNTIDARMQELTLPPAAKEEKETMTWAPLTGPKTAPNGVQVVPLASQHELQEEGEVMHHCVGSYGAECYKGNNFILSLRSASGEHLSTLHLAAAGESLYVQQHKGPHNHAPPAECAAAADWYMKEIRERNASALQDLRARQRRIEAATAATAVVGYDPFSPEACSQAFEIHKPCLPKRHRDMDYQTWLKEIKLEEAATVFLDGVQKRLQPG